MDNRTSLIPATRSPKQLMVPPPAPRLPQKRRIPASIRYIVILATVGVIGFGVLFGVAKSSQPKGAPGVPLTAFNAYQKTFASHCDVGQPFAVGPNDTLASLAKKFGATPQALAYTNGLSPNITLVQGQVLCPPIDNVTAPIITGTSSLEPCQSTNYWLPVITQWAVPPGCFGTVYSPNPADYPYRPTWGWCNWWPEETHPNLQGDAALRLPKHHTPIVGATVWFDGGEQGASSDGHWAELVAINPDGYWLLISEMNNTWRGAGWSKIDYRYVHMSPGVWFQY
jgi:hypothetical protein